MQLSVLPAVMANHAMSLDDDWHVYDSVSPAVMADVSSTVFPCGF